MNFKSGNFVVSSFFLCLPDKSFKRQRKERKNNRQTITFTQDHEGNLEHSQQHPSIRFDSTVREISIEISKARKCVRNSPEILPAYLKFSKRVSRGKKRGKTRGGEGEGEEGKGQVPVRLLSTELATQRQGPGGAKRCVWHPRWLINRAASKLASRQLHSYFLSNPSNIYARRVAPSPATLRFV